jgi:hypothetical protein
MFAMWIRLLEPRLSGAGWSAEENDMAQKSAGGSPGGIASKGGDPGSKGGRGGGGKGGSGGGTGGGKGGKGKSGSK